ncbi:MAG TPA: hypothetical protein VF657_09905 [Actinoplanes sp.]
MPYWLESDDFHDRAVWEVLADGVADVVDQLQAAYARLKSKASHLLSDGYLTEGAALAMCRGRKRTLDRLCTPVLEEKPLLHRQGDECDCLGENWIPGYAYRIHAFLKRNPSKREYNRNRAQKADLRDPALKDLAYRRDGGCCRYCTSGPLSPKAGRSKDRRKVLHYDHVDPDQVAGPDAANLVVACARCNELKGHRTPAEADMVLLPPPPPEIAAGLRQRALQLHDEAPAGGYPNHPPTSDGSATNHEISDQNQEQEQKHDADPIGDPITDHHHVLIDNTTPPVCPAPTTTATDHRTDQGPEGSGMGRGGTPALIHHPQARYQGQPARTPDSPDIYHRRSRPAPPPEISAEPFWPPVWPAGSIPVPTAPPAPDHPAQPQHPEEN